MWAELLVDYRQGVPLSILSARFHNSLTTMLVQVCQDLRQRFGLRQVALSGGVWQNRFLLNASVKALQQADFQVLLHRQTPANDGGLALGQAAVAVARLTG